jgi:NADH:ubiquinone oxidoreductase subunit K
MSIRKKVQSFIGVDEMQGNGALKMNQIEKSERRSYAQMFFLLVIMVVAANVAII